MAIIGDAQLLIGAVTTGMEKAIESDANKAIAKAQKSVKPIKIQADTAQAEDAFHKLGQVAKVVAGAAIVAGLKRAIDAGAQWATTVRTLSAVTGASTEEASKLAFVFEKIGVSADSVTRPLVIFSRNIQEGSEKFKKYFTNAELASLKTHGLVPDLELAAKKFQGLATVTEKNTFLMDVFGRGGLGLRRVLSLNSAEFAKSAAEAQKFGLVLSEDNVIAFRKFQEAERSVSAAFKGLEVQLGVAVVPALTHVANATADVISVFTKVPGPIKDVAVVGAGGALALATLASGVSFVVRNLGPLVKGFADGARAVVTFASNLAVPDAALANLTAEEAAATAGAVTLQTALLSFGAAAAVIGVGLLIKSLFDAERQAKETAAAVNSIPEVQRKIVDLQKQLGETGKKAGSFTFVNPLKDLLDIGKGGTELDKLGSKLQAYQERLKVLQREQSAEAGALHLTGDEAKKAAEEHQNLVDTLAAGVAGAKAQDDALASLNSTVDLFGPVSKQATEAEQHYAEALLRSQGFALDGTDDEKKLAEARGKAAQAALDAAKKEQDATDQRIAANLKLITSFDTIKQSGVASSGDIQAAEDKRKSALDGLNKAEEHLLTVKKNQKSTAQDILAAEDAVTKAQHALADSQSAVAAAGVSALDKFLDATQKNTVTVTNFFSDIDKLARAGFKGIARELLAEGPSAEAAAHEAVARMGSKQGLGGAEKVAEDAITAAKLKADEGLDKWVPNFQGKASNAVTAFAHGLSGLPPAVKAMVDQSDGNLDVLIKKLLTLGPTLSPFDRALLISAGKEDTLTTKANEIQKVLQDIAKARTIQLNIHAELIAKDDARIALSAITSGGSNDLIVGVPGAASGGSFPGGGWGVVGEKGPELVRFPAGGGTVFSNGDTQRLLRAVLAQGQSQGADAVSTGGDRGRPTQVFEKGAVQITTAQTDERVLANELSHRLAREAMR